MRSVLVEQVLEWTGHAVGERCHEEERQADEQRGDGEGAGAWRERHVEREGHQQGQPDALEDVDAEQPPRLHARWETTPS